MLPIHGTLVRRTVGLEAESGLMSYATIGAELDAALANPAVRAILLDLDSPGGEAGGVFDLAERIRAAAQVKPVWAVANDLAFSAAYALAAGASRLFVSRTGGVGSIGVIALHVDQSAQDARAGLAYTPVFAGARKNDLDPHAPLTAAAHAVLQAEVDRIYELFVNSVAAAPRARSRSRARDRSGPVLRPGCGQRGPRRCGRQLRRSAGRTAFACVTPAPALAVRVGGGIVRSISLQEQPMNEAPPSCLPPPVAPRRPRCGGSTRRPRRPRPSRLLTSGAASAAPPPVEPAIPMPIVDAVTIAETCQLAGRSDLIAGFLAAAATPAEVRRQLLAAQAEASPEIASRIDPNAAARTDPASPDNPLLQAVKQRLAAHYVTPKP